MGEMATVLYWHVPQYDKKEMELSEIKHAPTRGPRKPTTMVSYYRENDKEIR